MATNKEKGGSETTKKKSPKTKAKQIWKPTTAEKDEKDIMLRPSMEWEATPQTVERVMEVSNMIVKGGSRQTIQNDIMQKWEVGDRQARAYYSAAMRYLIPNDEDEYKRCLIQANIDRLEEIIQRTMNDDDYKNAIAAIKEINRIIAPNNKNEVEVMTQDTAFRIRFGE